MSILSTLCLEILVGLPFTSSVVSVYPQIVVQGDESERRFDGERPMCLLSGFDDKSEARKSLWIIRSPSVLSGLPHF